MTSRTGVAWSPSSAAFTTRVRGAHRLDGFTPPAGIPQHRSSGVLTPGSWHDPNFDRFLTNNTKMVTWPAVSPLGFPRQVRAALAALDPVGLARFCRLLQSSAGENFSNGLRYFSLDSLAHLWGDSEGPLSWVETHRQVDDFRARSLLSGPDQSLAFSQRLSQIAGQILRERAPVLEVSPSQRQSANAEQIREALLLLPDPLFHRLDSYIKAMEDDASAGKDPDRIATGELWTNDQVYSSLTLEEAQTYTAAATALANLRLFEPFGFNGNRIPGGLSEQVKALAEDPRDRTAISRDSPEALSRLTRAMHPAARAQFLGLLQAPNILSANSAAAVWGVPQYVAERQLRAFELLGLVEVVGEDSYSVSRRTDHLRMAVAELDVRSRLDFALLSAFAPSPATFDLRALEAIWQCSSPQANGRAKKLVELGLLQRAPSRREGWYQISPECLSLAQVEISKL
jgi:hypothetical protein